MRAALRVAPYLMAAGLCACGDGNSGSDHPDGATGNPASGGSTGHAGAGSTQLNGNTGGTTPTGGTAGQQHIQDGGTTLTTDAGTASDTMPPTPDAAPPDTAPMVDPPEHCTLYGQEVSEGDRCNGPGGHGTCRDGACCIWCWDGKRCVPPEEQNDDVCGQQGKRCRAMGFQCTSPPERGQCPNGWQQTARPKCATGQEGGGSVYRLWCCPADMCGGPNCYLYVP